MTSVSAGHIILTPTQPVGSGRPQREWNPGPPHQESRALLTELPGPQKKKKKKKKNNKKNKKNKKKNKKKNNKKNKKKKKTKKKKKKNKKMNKKSKKKNKKENKKKKEDQEEKQKSKKKNKKMNKKHKKSEATTMCTDVEIQILIGPSEGHVFSTSSCFDCPALFWVARPQRQRQNRSKTCRIL